MIVTITNPDRVGSIRVLTQNRGRGDMLGRAVDCFMLKPGETRETTFHKDQMITLQLAA